MVNLDDFYVFLKKEINTYVYRLNKQKKKILSDYTGYTIKKKLSMWPHGLNYMGFS